ncbi:reverse transcriptase [Trichonephila clavipes]|nr:reverse transcriptase [Trichonephila clavipes]
MRYEYTGWFYRLFEGSMVVGKNATNYDGEVLAVCEATTHLPFAGLAPAKVVFSIDSQVANLVLSSNAPTDCLKWVPSHVGTPGNERANQKAKQGAESIQPEVPLTLRSSKSIFSTHIDKYTVMTPKTKSFGKPWETLTTVGPIPRHLERAEAVARFRLTNEHDFSGVYLH